MDTTLNSLPPLVDPGTGNNAHGGLRDAHKKLPVSNLPALRDDGDTSQPTNSESIAFSKKPIPEETHFPGHRPSRPDEEQEGEPVLLKDLWKTLVDDQGRFDVKWRTFLMFVISACSLAKRLVVVQSRVSERHGIDSVQNTPLVTCDCVSLICFRVIAWSGAMYLRVFIYSLRCLLAWRFLRPVILPIYDCLKDVEGVANIVDEETSAREKENSLNSTAVPFVPNPSKPPAPNAGPYFLAEKRHRRRRHRSRASVWEMIDDVMQTPKHENPVEQSKEQVSSNVADAETKDEDDEEVLEITAMVAKLTLSAIAESKPASSNVEVVVETTDLFKGPCQDIAGKCEVVPAVNVVVEVKDSPLLNEDIALEQTEPSNLIEEQFAKADVVTEQEEPSIVFEDHVVKGDSDMAANQSGYSTAVEDQPALAGTAVEQNGLSSVLKGVNEQDEPSGTFNEQLATTDAVVEQTGLSGAFDGRLGKSDISIELGEASSAFKDQLAKPGAVVERTESSSVSVVGDQQSTNKDKTLVNIVKVQVAKPGVKPLNTSKVQVTKRDTVIQPSECGSMSIKIMPDTLKTPVVGSLLFLDRAGKGRSNHSQDSTYSLASTAAYLLPKGGKTTIEQTPRRKGKRKGVSPVPLALEHRNAGLIPPILLNSGKDFKVKDTLTEGSPNKAAARSASVHPKDAHSFKVQPKRFQGHTQPFGVHPTNKAESSASDRRFGISNRQPQNDRDKSKCCIVLSPVSSNRRREFADYDDPYMFVEGDEDTEDLKDGDDDEGSSSSSESDAEAEGDVDPIPRYRRHPGRRPRGYDLALELSDWEGAA